MTVHELKTWPGPFEAIVSGAKTFEVRQNDRNFRVGDWLLLREWSPINRDYTDRQMLVGVTYILPGGQFGLPVNMCVMSVVPVDTLT